MELRHCLRAPWRRQRPAARHNRTTRWSRWWPPATGMRCRPRSYATVCASRFIARMTKDAPAAADLTSEVFLEVWRQAGRFQGRSQVSTWLLAIARYKAVSALRRYVPEELDKEAAECIEDPADSPQAAIEGRQRSELIRRTLTQLSPAHREVIDLVYYHERSIDEVAAIVGIPQNTVKTRLFNARKRMADLLPADEFSPRRISGPHERCRFGAPINVSKISGRPHEHPPRPPRQTGATTCMAEAAIPAGFRCRRHTEEIKP